MKLALPILTFLSLVVFSLTGSDEKSQRITLANIDDRHWLIDANGSPFFAHGITHVNVQRAKPPINKSKFSELCKELGFNAYGYGCPPQLKSDMPYIESWSHLVQSAYYRGKNGVKFVDIFDPKEQDRLDAGVKLNCYLGRNSRQNIIGYCWTDLGSWPLKNPSGTNWVEYIRALPEDTPGQKAYQEFLSTWEGEDETARDQEFLRLIAREYFRVVGEATRKYDPGALVFGDRFGFNTFDPVVVKEMLPWVDGIAIQPPFNGPFPKAKFDEIHALTGKPIILCDFAIRFKDGDKDIRAFKPARDSVDAGKQYADYIKAALETDYIVGAFWCNPVDTPKGFNNPGVKQGFFGPSLSERPGLHQAVKELNAFREEVTPDSTAAASHTPKVATADTVAEVEKVPAKTETETETAEVAPKVSAWVAGLLKELNLTEEQRPKFIAIQQGMVAKWAELQKMSAEERNAEQTAYYLARFEELEQLLTEEQMTSYRKFRAQRNAERNSNP
ncbi:MAG: beta-agarase [Verrucomicrobiota bacterium]